MSQTTVLEILQSGSARREKALFATLSVILGSLLIAGSALVKVPFYGTPVPLTLQTFVVILLGMALGPRLGAAAAFLYFVECASLPVLSASGNLALTGGYLLGFVPAAWIAGHLFRRGRGRSLAGALATMIPANLAIFAFGVPWLAMSIGWANAWNTGFVAFILVEAVKIALCVPLMCGVSRFSRQMEDTLR